ncbi:MAG: MBOAT family O-acyltransferase, partial [Paraclostridium sp.]
WFLTGLWHGASYNFILWGLYFGFILMLEKLFLLDLLNSIPRIFRHIYTMLFVILGFVIFEITNISSIIEYISSMFSTSNGFTDETFYYYLVPNILLLVLSILASTPIFKHILDKYEIIRFVSLILGMIIAVSFLVDSSFNPFLYFRF